MTVCLFGQNGNEKPNAPRNQIGIDVQRLFSGNIGTNLIYKRKSKQKPLNAFRISANFIIDESLSDESDFGEIPTFGNARDFRQERTDFSFRVGLEKTIGLRDKLSVYYGAEIGYRYVNANTIFGFSRTTDTDGNILEYLIAIQEVKNNRAIVGIFGGFKYRLNETFSFSIESGIESYYSNNIQRRKDESLISGEKTDGDKVKNNRFYSSFDFLKFLNFEINF